MRKHKRQATLTRLVIRFKPLTVPATVLLINVALFVHQVVQVFLGMPDWGALLAQTRDTADSASEFKKAVAALPKKQSDGTRRNDRDVPPAC